MQTAYTRVTDLSTITTIHFVVIVLVALFAIAVIVVGIRLARRRAHGERAAERDMHAVSAAPAPELVEDHHVPAPPVAPPTGEPIQFRAETATPVGDDLTRLKGLGPRIAARLADFGITSIAELAALSPERAALLDAEIGPPFSGRIARDRWVEQARLLAAGDVAGYESAFGKLGS